MNERSEGRDRVPADVGRPAGAPAAREAKRPPISSLTSGELTQAGKEALLALARQDMPRVKSGWRAGNRRVSLRVADMLQARGLAREEVMRFRRRLTITGAGRMLVAVLEERKRA